MHLPCADNTMPAGPWPGRAPLGGTCVQRAAQAGNSHSAVAASAGIDSVNTAAAANEARTVAKKWAMRHAQAQPMLRPVSQRRSVASAKRPPFTSGPHPAPGEADAPGLFRSGEHGGSFCPVLHAGVRRTIHPNRAADATELKTLIWVS